MGITKPTTGGVALGADPIAMDAHRTRERLKMMERQNPLRERAHSGDNTPWADSLEELQASGKVKGVDKTFSTFALIGMCSWLFYWFDYSRKDSAAKVSETFLEIFFRGIFI